MYETEIQAMPETYFSIDVAGLAQFVICAADNDFAFLRLREYCKENTFLRIDPDSHFDIFNKVEPVSAEDANYYKKTQIGQNVVRMTSYTETNVVDMVQESIIDLRLDAPKQLEFFVE